MSGTCSRSDQVLGIPRWQLDALKVELAFMRHIGAERPEFTETDAQELEAWCHALMQATRQMSGGYPERGQKGDECGDLVSFDDLPTILNNIAVCACRMVLAGAHVKGYKNG